MSIPGTLWCGYFPAWIGYLTRWRVIHQAWTDCKFCLFCWYFFRQFSSALLVIMSIEKFIALYFPLKIRNICTVKTARWVSGIAFFIYALFNSQFFVTGKSDKIKVCTYDEPFDDYINIYIKVDGVLYSYAPLAIMGVANMAIIYKFIKAKLASKGAGTESTNQAMSSAAMRGTAILITVSLMFLVLTGPYNIMYAIDLYPNRILAGALSILELPLTTVSILLSTVLLALNSGKNS